MLVVPTGIHIVKTASDDLVPAGTDVTYTYDVSNIGLVPLADVVVDDDFCPTVTPAGPPFTGDTDGDDLLDVGEVFVFTCTTAITETTTNTATITGIPTLPDGRTGDPVTDADEAVVETFTSGIALDSRRPRPRSSGSARRSRSRSWRPTPATPISSRSESTDEQCSPTEFLGESRTATA